MGLAVTWCNTVRRLMGRAALHQQTRNEVQHRFSPYDHDNVKVLQLALCETAMSGHHLLSVCGPAGPQASRKYQSDFGEKKKSDINTIN